MSLHWTEEQYQDYIGQHPPKRNKYGNQKITIDGITRDSLAESNRLEQLKILQRAGAIKNLQFQVPFGAVAVGHTDEIEQEIPFINADDDFFNSLINGQNVSMTLRGSQQVTDSSTGTIKNVPVRVVLGGIVKKIKLGSLKQAGLGNPSFTLSLNYYLHEFNGQKRIEIDKLNSVCVINGNDLMAEINSQC